MPPGRLVPLLFHRFRGAIPLPAKPSTPTSGITVTITQTSAWLLLAAVPARRRLLRKKTIYRLLREIIYWSLETRVIGFKYSETMLDLIAGRAARKHIKTQIKDPVLRQKVTPEFTIGCKRIILSDNLYPAYCR